MQTAEVSAEECSDKHLKELVKRLLEEHHDFSAQRDSLERDMVDSSELSRMSEVFILFREALTEHMLVEESEIFPEVSRRGLFKERVSEIMQQHQKRYHRSFRKHAIRASREELGIAEKGVR